jgi:UDP-N-acetylglucosamine acyltransferase
MMNIHPTAIIDPNVELGEDVFVGPFTVIGKGVTIGDGTSIYSHVNIEGKTVLGKNCKVFPFSSLGTAPQDFKYKGDETRLIIGDNTIIREYVTINRATGMDEWVTKVGNNCYFMAYSHIAHNSMIGNNVVVANVGTLAGHVVVEDFAIIGGIVGLHQFTRVGCYSIVGACSGIGQDVLPYSRVSGMRARTYGINSIGLQRHNFPREKIQKIKSAFKIIFNSKLNTTQAVERIQNEIKDSSEVDHILDFIKKTKRGICK